MDTGEVQKARKYRLQKRNFKINGNLDFTHDSLPIDEKNGGPFKISYTLHRYLYFFNSILYSPRCGAYNYFCVEPEGIFKVFYSITSYKITMQLMCITLTSYEYIHESV